MRDPTRYRAGVGLVLTNRHGRVWLGRRVSRDGWQLPQGGIDPGEETEAAAWRELHEEVGTRNVELLRCTTEWTFYDFPPETAHLHSWDGQRHRWYLFRHLGDDAELHPASVPIPEFDGYRWVTPAEAVAAVVPFKRPVYQRMFLQLELLPRG